MSSDITFFHDSLSVSMDFLEVDQRSGGVRVKICVEYHGLHQQLKWIHDGIWIEYSSLSSFESQLGEGLEAVLTNMSMYSILKFRRDQQHECLTINPPAERMPVDADAIAVNLLLGMGAMEKFYRALADFAKWW